MLTPLPIDQIEARNMESVAVVKADLDHLGDVTGWTFEPGADDFDAFEGAVFELDRVGYVGLVRYHGQPSDSVSILAPQGTPGTRIAQLILGILRPTALSKRDLTWTARVAQRPLSRLFAAKSDLGQGRRRAVRSAPVQKARWAS